METMGAKKEVVQVTEIKMPCRLGLHARTASRFILFVRQFRSSIRIIKGEFVADGKSILGLLVLGASWRTKLRFEVQGEDAEHAIQAIESYFLIPENCLDHY